MHRSPRTLLPFILSLAAVFFFAQPALAAEYKLVLQPEPGTSVPARVCLASRSVAMQAVELPNMRPLAAKDRCVEGAEATCAVERGPPATGCGMCAGEAHPDCRARVKTGRFPASDYTVVCADDGVRPADGGTVYIVVESVEAENPPEFYGLEVSGGRVRWSPINRLSRPSYRVIGGDFEEASLSYPRGDGTPEWVEVPIRRRCRCMTTRQPVSGAAILSAEVDGDPICRGEPAPDGTLRIEVPANPAGAVRQARVRTADSEASMRWSTRWPVPDQQARLVRFRFELARDCVRPALMACPEVSAHRTTCDRPDPVSSLCRYTCTTEATAAIDMPLELNLRIDLPEVQWRSVLRAPGQRLRGAVPPVRRVLTVRIPDFERRTPGDRVWGIQVGRVGRDADLLVLDSDGPLYVPLADLRCGTSLAVSYRGHRVFAPAAVRVGPGGAVDLPPPHESAEAMSLLADVALGVGSKGLFGDTPSRVAATDTLVSLNASLSLRHRDFGSQGFGAIRLGLDFAPDDLFLGGGELSDGRRIYGSRDEPFIGLELSLMAGYVLSAADGLVEIYGGPGVGAGYPMTLDLGASGGPTRRLIGTIGLRRPLGVRLSRWSLFAEAKGLLKWFEPPIAVLGADAEVPTGGSGSTDVNELEVVGQETGPTRWSWAFSVVLGVGYLF